MASAFEKCCRRRGHDLSAVYDPERPFAMVLGFKRQKPQLNDRRGPQWRDRLHLAGRGWSSTRPIDLLFDGQVADAMVVNEDRDDLVSVYGPDSRRWRFRLRASRAKTAERTIKNSSIQSSIGPTPPSVFIEFGGKTTLSTQATASRDLHAH